MKQRGSIFGVAVLSAVVVLPAAKAAAEDSSILQISAVLASRERRAFDPRLESLRHDLRSFPFKGYTLMGIQSCRFQTGDQCAMDIPGGGYLHIRTTESTPDHLKMRLLLIQGNRPILNTDVKLNRNAKILLKSARTESGTIIVSIKAPSTTAIKSLEKATLK